MKSIKIPSLLLCFFVLLIPYKLPAAAAASTTPIEEPPLLTAIHIGTIYTHLLPYLGLTDLPNLCLVSKDTNKLLQEHHITLNAVKEYQAWEGTKTLSKVSEGKPGPLMIYTFNETLDQFLRYMGHVFYILRDNELSAYRYREKIDLHHLPPLYTIRGWNVPIPHEPSRYEIPVEETDAFNKTSLLYTLTQIKLPNRTLQKLFEQAQLRVFFKVPKEPDGAPSEELEKLKPFEASEIRRDIAPSANKRNRMAAQVFALLFAWMPYFDIYPLHKVQLKELPPTAEERLTDEEILIALAYALNAVHLPAGLPHEGAAGGAGAGAGAGVSSSMTHGEEEKEAKAKANVSVGGDTIDKKRTLRPKSSQVKLGYEIALQHVILYVSATKQLPLIHDIMGRPHIPRAAKIVYANTLFELAEVEALNSFNTVFPVPRLLILLLNTWIRPEDKAKVLSYYEPYAKGIYPYPEIMLTHLIEDYCSRIKEIVRKSLIFDKDASDWDHFEGPRYGRKFSSWPLWTELTNQTFVRLVSYFSLTRMWNSNTVDALERLKGGDFSKEEIKAARYRI